MRAFYGIRDDLQRIGARAASAASAFTASDENGIDLAHDIDADGANRVEIGDLRIEASRGS